MQLNTVTTPSHQLWFEHCAYNSWPSGIIAFVDLIAGKTLGVVRSYSDLRTRRILLETTAFYYDEAYGELYTGTHGGMFQQWMCHTWTYMTYLYKNNAINDVVLFNNKCWSDFAVRSPCMLGPVLMRILVHVRQDQSKRKLTHAFANKQSYFGKRHSTM